MKCGVSISSAGKRTLLDATKPQFIRVGMDLTNRSQNAHQRIGVGNITSGKHDCWRKKFVEVFSRIFVVLFFVFCSGEAK